MRIRFNKQKSFAMHVLSVMNLVKKRYLITLLSSNQDHPCNFLFFFLFLCFCFFTFPCSSEIDPIPPLKGFKFVKSKSISCLDIPNSISRRKMLLSRGEHDLVNRNQC